MFISKEMIIHRPGFAWLIVKST